MVHRRNTIRAGFTIVELLIVIVVIAILAAISIVAYTNIQARARVSTVQSDLRNISQKLELYKIDHGSYPLSGPQILRSGIGDAVSFPTTSRAILCGTAEEYAVVMSAGESATTGRQFVIGSRTALTEIDPRITWGNSNTVCGETGLPVRGWSHNW